MRFFRGSPCAINLDFEVSDLGYLFDLSACDGFSVHVLGRLSRSSSSVVRIFHNAHNAGTMNDSQQIGPIRELTGVYFGGVASEACMRPQPAETPAAAARGSMWPPESDVTMAAAMVAMMVAIPRMVVFICFG